MEPRDRERACLALISGLPGMSSLALPAYLRVAGSGQALWEAITSDSQVSLPVDPERIGVWRKALRGKEPEEYLEELAKKGIRVLLPGDSEYPLLLNEIYDPPPLIYVRGLRLPSADSRSFVGVVGSRRCSDYGRETAFSLSRSLAERGVVIVSGAAYGVDGWAHRGCLEKGGFTIAVLGCGVDVVYPSFHRDLLELICERGAVISEYPPGTEPAPWRFPHRNRIIAGMCHFLVVVEAAERSGALITAQLALEEGRDVGAVPGPVNSPLSFGTNALIQKGAKLVRSGDDVLEELPPHLWGGFQEVPRDDSTAKKTRQWGVGPVARMVDEGMGNLGAGTESKAPRGKNNGSEICPWLQDDEDPAEGGEEDSLEDMEKEVLRSLTEGTKDLDQLALELGSAVGELLSCLTNLKMRGLIHERAGGLFCVAVPSWGKELG